MNRSDCYRLERQLPGGFRTRWEKAPFNGAREVQANPYRALFFLEATNPFQVLFL